LTPYFLNSPSDEKGIDADFVQEAVNRFAEDDTPKNMLRNAMRGLSLQLSGLNMSSNYKPYVEVE
jgi:ubiquitin conjugation factor E4 B